MGPKFWLVYSKDEEAHISIICYRVALCLPNRVVKWFIDGELSSRPKKNVFSA